MREKNKLLKKYFYETHSETFFERNVSPRPTPLLLSKDKPLCREFPILR